MIDIDALKVIEAYKRIKGECPNDVQSKIIETVNDFKEKELWDKLLIMTGIFLEDETLSKIDWKNPYRPISFDNHNQWDSLGRLNIFGGDNSCKMDWYPPKFGVHNGTNEGIIIPPKPTGTDEQN